MSRTREGRCHCGAVRYRVREPFKFVAHDHCGICRHISGGMSMTWAGVMADAFEILTGEGELAAYRSTPPAERHFCRTCGTQLFFRSERWPGERHFTLASLEDQSGIEPNAHVFWSDRAAWEDGAGELPKLGGPSGVEPLPTDG